MEQKINPNAIVVKAYSVTTITAGYLNELYLFILVGVLLMAIEILVWPRNMQETMLSILAEHSASLVLYVVSSWALYGFSISIKIAPYIIFSIATLMLLTVIMVYSYLNSKDSKGE